MAAETYLRKARIGDVKSIHGLLYESSRQGLLLPRSFSDLYSRLRDYVVAADRESDVVQGCCALSICWENLAEIRSLVVSADQRGRGLGRKLVEACLSDAMTLGLYSVFVLTYQVDFFRGLNFAVVEKDTLPQKVWADCIHCAKFPECDETAMLTTL